MRRDILGSGELIESVFGSVSISYNSQTNGRTRDYNEET